MGYTAAPFATAVVGRIGVQVPHMMRRHLSTIVSALAAGARPQNAVEDADNPMIRRYFPLLCCLLLAACARPELPDLTRVPFAHRIDVQQGNVVTQDMIAQLKPGMDKKKVNFIMGSPVIQDTFHADRWDYVYTFQAGRKKPVKRLVTLYFEKEKLVRVGGNVKAADGPIDIDTRQDQSVEVPGKKTGVLAKIANTLPFVGPEGTSDARVEADEVKAEAVPEVVVPDDAPMKKKKGFLARIFGRDDGSDDDDLEAATEDEEIEED
jgi:outer membrane protein assembly factor BamE